MSRTQVWSCGGGTQSAAIAALIVRGKLPKPDISLIVDTNREKSQTWAYMDAVLTPALAKVGVEIVRIDKAELATVDLYSGNGDLLIPAFTTQEGDMAKLPTFCSNEWKSRVTKRWLREQGVESAIAWMGISLDELSRVRTPTENWYHLRYPLIWDVPMNRQNCIATVQQMGWPDPPRSSCWMCPNMRQGEWREMRENWPDDFQRAVELERELRLKDEHIYLHEQCVPLDQVDFSDNQIGLFPKGCDTGYCFV